ncbi:hypothetical protein V1512DRAFT_207123 [Lipomyces arxii]|uniref:uncharacterized protein n=1 Tax=Lipomyces arxii TaxID=56418 RepID=UPI0034CD1835
MGSLKLAEIQLSKTEKEIEQLLVDASAYIDESQTDRSEDLVLRFTGGWVRDKLLGYESHDLDVAVNCMTGYDFANRLQEFLVKNPLKYGESMKGIHKIEMNPDKSKHLETATANIHGVDLDFVNLRTESYANDSRIPVMEFGTPEQDAYRRDATINALFYNLHTGKIEDFTGRGLDDLRKGVIATPLPALETFTDDPLRVLRLIRFAGRFGFQIEKLTFGAMKADVINAAVQEKVSKERIGIEVHKMLLGTGAHTCSLLLIETNIYSAIFKPLQYDIKTVEYDMQRNVEIAEDLVVIVRTLMFSKHKQMFFSEVEDQRELRLVQYLFALVAPWSSVKVSTKFDTTMLLIRDSLKLSTARATEVANVVKQVPSAIELVTNGGWTRVNIGMAIRNFGKNWQLVFFSAFVTEIHRLQGREDNWLESPAVVHLNGQYDRLLQFVTKNNLAGSWSMKPIIDGKVVMKALNLQSGPWLKNLLPKVVEWQLEFPDKSAEDCIEHVKTLEL